MIKVNGEVVNIEFFPDGTPRVNIDADNIKENPYDDTHLGYINIEWNYESNDEMFYLMLIKRHLEKFLTNVDYYLYLPYIPNGRMDRTKNIDEVFTLKYFCEFINWLDFDGVYVVDAHSDVSVALLNKCENDNPKVYINKAISKIGMRNLVLYFPDSGAAKRYAGLFPEIPYCYGEKNRDWKTGKILGLDIRTNGIDLVGKNILMVDDICSRGGTFYYGAQELNKYGVHDIYLYVTHCENTILDGELFKSGLIKRIFTTNSIFTKKHNDIEIMKL